MKEIKYGNTVFRMKEIKYKVEKTKEPNDDGKYAVYFESKTDKGMNCGIVEGTKGNYKDCVKKKEEIEEETHETRLLEYLKKHETITQLEATNVLGNTRLSATVFNLRNKGYNIITLPKKGKNRFGKSTSFGAYKLEG